MDTATPLFADLILPLALQQLYTYRVPTELQQVIAPGQRVTVPFGKSKMYTALVHTVHQRKPEHYEARTILELLDDLPSVNEQQLKFWEWLSEYYLCTLGEIFIAALPSELKLQSETMIALRDDYIPELEILSGEEQYLINQLGEQKNMSVHDAARLTGSDRGLKLVRKMIERGVLTIHEELRETFKPRQFTYVKFSEKAEDEHFLKELFESLEKKAPKQLDLLMGFMRLKTEKGKDCFNRPFLLKQTHSSPGALQQLVSKGVFELFQGDESAGYLPVEQTGLKLELSDLQREAYEKIQLEFNHQKAVLLHGVTSSGKTEIYIKLISEMMSQGKQVLYLLPEIALTTQIITRLKSHFGERLLIYHSRFSSRERAEVYMKLVKDGHDGNFRFPIIVGARSAIFLPLKNPGLIIVDEEHDGSYKQHDPAPRYHARDGAVMLGHLHHCHILLGSATPGMESYYNAERSKYGLVELSERFGGIKMPEIKIIDLKDAYRKRSMKGHFSKELLDAIEATLGAGEQVILFQNRRGFAPVLECKRCGWIPHCINCDVTLTYHKKSNHLRCHYCGYSTPMPAKCNACGDPDIRMKGLGTERVEDDISIHFPDHTVERLDLDTGSSRSAYQRIIAAFESGETDILVGTQMVTKGLHFDHVGLVGVLNADTLIHFPDFRSVERSYQLLAQVSGRAGRKFKRGRVLIQTFNTAHPLLQFLLQNDYLGFYRHELREREQFIYPPFCRMIQLRLKHKDLVVLNELSKALTVELKSVFGKRVLGPVDPPVGRVRNYYLKNILLKIEKTLSDRKVKEMLMKVTDRFLSHEEHRKLIIQVDVDPV